MTVQQSIRFPGLLDLFLDYTDFSKKQSVIPVFGAKRRKTGIWVETPPRFLPEFILSGAEGQE